MFEASTFHDLCAIALTQDGLSKGRPEDIERLAAAATSTPFPSGITLRKSGRIINKDRLNLLGLRSSVIISFEFMESLTYKGLINPIDSAQWIMSALLNRHAMTKRIDNYSRELGNNTMVEIVANNMLAGPCPACLSLTQTPVPINKAPRGPLSACPHPSQCYLNFRVI